MLDDIAELKALIVAQLDISDLLDILGMDVVDLVDLLDEQIEENAALLRKSLR